MFHKNTDVHNTQRTRGSKKCKINKIGHAIAKK